jgi:hypothetical protein
MSGVAARDKALMSFLAVIAAVAVTSVAVSDDRVENLMAAAYYGKLDGETALMFAALKGHLKVVKLLLERGAKVNAKDIRGNTALSYASEKGHAHVCQFLLEHNAK